MKMVMIATKVMIDDVSLLICPNFNPTMAIRTENSLTWVMDIPVRKEVRFLNPRIPMIIRMARGWIMMTKRQSHITAPQLDIAERFNWNPKATKKRITKKSRKGLMREDISKVYVPEAMLMPAKKAPISMESPKRLANIAPTKHQAMAIINKTSGNFADFFKKLLMI